MKILKNGLRWLPFVILPVVLLCTTVDFDDLDSGIIDDTIPPVITIAGEKVQTINVNTAYEPITVTALDLVDGDLTANIDTTGSIDTSTVGTHKMWFTVSDLSLNSAKDSFVVIVIDPSSKDSIDPVITIDGDNPDTITVGDSWTNPDATASDNEDGNITANIQITGTVDPSKAGTYNVIYTVTDAAGNSTSDTLVVVVKNSGSTGKQPTLILKGEDSITIALGDLFEEPGYTAIDTLGDTLSDIVAKAVVTITKYDSTDTKLAATDTIGKTEGLFKISYVLNYDGGSDTEVRKVRVTNDDLTPPVITLLEPSRNPDTVWNSAAAKYSELDPGAIAIDGGTDTITVVDGDSVTMSVAGEYKYYYSATDSNGNAADTFRVVIVQIDTVAPVISISKASDTIEIGETWDSVTVTALDNADGDLTDSIKATGSVDNSKKGVNNIIYTVTDAAGKTTSDTVKVYVFALPTIQLIGSSPDTIILGAAAYIDSGAQITDNIDDIDTIDAYDSDQLDLDNENIDTIHYTYVDADGNATDTVERIVVVYDIPDTLKPTITIVGKNPDTIWVGDTYVDSGATAYDVKDGDITKDIDTNNQVLPGTAGEYSVIYTVADAAGNADTATRTVVVKADTEKPVITIPGDNPDTIWVDDSYTIPTATATDNKDGSVTVTPSGTVKTDSAGTYTITYTATDAAGNTATEDLKVVVKGVGTELIIENFEGTEKGQITLWDDGTTPNQSFGWWYLYLNAGSKIEPAPTSQADTITGKVVESAKKNGTYGLHATYTLGGSGDLYATMAFDLKDGSYYDLSSLNRVSLWAKGSGTMRLNFVTKWVTDSASWGHFGVDIPLTAEWKEHKINIDQIAPEKWSPAETANKKWSDADVGNKVSTIEFSVSGDAGKVVDFTMDDLRFYGVSSISQ